MRCVLGGLRDDPLPERPLDRCDRAQGLPQSHFRCTFSIHRRPSARGSDAPCAERRRHQNLVYVQCSIFITALVW